MWVVTIYFKEKTPGGFISFGRHENSEHEAYSVADEIMESEYIPCWVDSDHSCLYVKQDYVKAVEVRPPKEKD